MADLVRKLDPNGELSPGERLRLNAVAERELEKEARAELVRTRAEARKSRADARRQMALEENHVES